MAIKDDWTKTSKKIKALRLDLKNPRLGDDAEGLGPSDIIQYLFDNDDATAVAKSIATRGFFQNEPLLVVMEDGHSVVVEGNRRLAALKALQEPDLLQGKHSSEIKRHSKAVGALAQMPSVPVVVAPSRKATDKLLSGRHVGSQVKSWTQENRARFILEKLGEGYSNDALRDDLGFTLSDIQGARQTKAIVDMARSLDFESDIQSKIENPRSKVLSTLDRVFKSKPGKAALFVEADPEHGLKGNTTAKQFRKPFRKLVEDLATGKINSRKLNKADDIENYFQELDDEHKAEKKKGSFVPSDIIKGGSGKYTPPKPRPKKKMPTKLHTTIIPKSFKVVYGNSRLTDIRGELVKLDRENHTNAGVVLLRVFLELAITDYLERIEELDNAYDKAYGNRSRPRHGGIELQHLVAILLPIAKKNMHSKDFLLAQKALKPDHAAPFSISELHGFIHHKDFPTARDILQFWTRLYPLFRFMLVEDWEAHKK